MEGIKKVNSKLFKEFTMQYTIYESMPENFEAKVEISGCYLVSKDKLLLLKRHLSRPQGNTWGVAAGKIEKNETPLMAVVREVKEEVSLNLLPEEIAYLGKLYCRLSHMDYIFHVFTKSYEMIPEIRLALEEHIEARWVTVEEARELPLIAGGVEALDFFLRKTLNIS